MNSHQLALHVVMTLALVSPTQAEPANSCIVAAHRVLGFLKAEAVGTRHEVQIANTIKEKGEGATIAGIAAGMSDDQCAMLIIAPDSTVRALALSMLPERSGQ